MRTKMFHFLYAISQMVIHNTAFISAWHFHNKEPEICSYTIHNHPKSEYKKKVEKKMRLKKHCIVLNRRVCSLRG